MTAPRFMSAQRVERLSPAQLLRRQMMAGEAPVLIDMADVQTLLGLSRRQVDNLVAEGKLEDMVMVGERSLYRAAAVPSLMLETPSRERNPRPCTARVYEPPQIERLEILGEKAGQASPVASGPSRAPTNADLAGELAPLIADIRAAGARTLQQIADGLNGSGLRTVTGSPWRSGSVAKVVDALAFA